MMGSILGGIQFLVNLFFLIAVFGTAGFSWWFSTKYRERQAKFPWKKAGIVLGIEILGWIGFNVFWTFFERNWLIIAAVCCIIVVFVIKGRKHGGTA